LFVSPSSTLSVCIAFSSTATKHYPKEYFCFHGYFFIGTRQKTQLSNLL
jgi:hypothetical protein